MQFAMLFQLLARGKHSATFVDRTREFLPFAILVFCSYMGIEIALVLVKPWTTIVGTLVHYAFVLCLVYATVEFQIALRVKQFVTLVATELATMFEPPVRHQLGPTEKLFRTVSTLLGVAFAPVAAHRSQADKTLTAVFASVRILAGVAYLM